MSNNQIDVITKSLSCSNMSMMYINGTSVSVFGTVSEFDVQRRKGWIERKLRATQDYSIENIAKYAKMSIFWLNYVSMGTRYPNVIDKETYKQWDKDKVKPNYVNMPKTKNRKR
jgi:hypothetical protein